MDVLPLIFEPIFKRRVWGGRRLETCLQKKLPLDDPIGESWEVADLEGDQSVVAVGPHAGKTFAEMIQWWGADLLGRAALIDGRFPLLLKFLDAAQPLSVQVHPSEEQARLAGGTVRMKNEAWYVIDAAPESWILRGLKDGVDAEELRRAIGAGRIETVMNRIPARRGHAYYLPSGTPHALGPGVLVAEVQTPSDVTYRLFDWNRVEPATGQPRDLHVELALSSMRYEAVPPQTEHPQHLASVWTSITSLVRCESFVVERVRMAAGVEQPIPHEELVIWMMLEGSGRVTCRGLKDPMSLGIGNTIVLPAGLKDARISVDETSLFLEVTLPIASSLEGFTRPDIAPFGIGPDRSVVKLGLPPVRSPFSPDAEPRNKLN